MCISFRGTKKEELLEFVFIGQRDDWVLKLCSGAEAKDKGLLRFLLSKSKEEGKLEKEES